jgi:hypothetical protein
MLWDNALDVEGPTSRFVSTIYSAAELCWLGGCDQTAQKGDELCWIRLVTYSERQLSRLGWRWMTLERVPCFNDRSVSKVDNPFTVSNFRSFTNYELNKGILALMNETATP